MSSDSLGFGKICSTLSCKVEENYNLSQSSKINQERIPLLILTAPLWGSWAAIVIFCGRHCRSVGVPASFSIFLLPFCSGSQPPPHEATCFWESWAHSPVRVSPPPSQLIQEWACDSILASGMWGEIRWAGLLGDVSRALWENFLWTSSCGSSGAILLFPEEKTSRAAEQRVGKCLQPDLNRKLPELPVLRSAPPQDSPVCEIIIIYFFQTILSQDFCYPQNHLSNTLIL